MRHNCCRRVSNNLMKRQTQRKPYFCISIIESLLKLPHYKEGKYEIYKSDEGYPSPVPIDTINFQ